MKNRKQSMREVRDAAQAERTPAAVAAIRDHVADPLRKVPGNTDRNAPRYYRGALVKPR